MKTVALIPFKNEEWILEPCLASLKSVADEIIGCDDGSTDRSVEIMKSHGAVVISNQDREISGWAEHSIRQRLLEHGRKRGGTHFICIDADEAIASHSTRGLRARLPTMKPGERLCLQWIALWKSPRKYRADASVWSNNFKDFVFCDDGASTHDYAFLGVGRTPGKHSPETTIRLPAEEACMLHFQAVPWARYQMKQAWYRCSELIKTPRDFWAINEKYSITLEDPNAGLLTTPDEWMESIPIRDDLTAVSPETHKRQILEYFELHGAKFFEPLEIWHIPELRQDFLRRVGRNPRVDFVTSIRKWKQAIRAKTHRHLGWLS
jgi:hypothetical protein